jgi:hypothetical protein
MANVETQLTSIANQLEKISIQERDATSGINTKLDQLETRVKDTKSATAKIWLQVLNFLILVAILILILFRGDVNNIIKFFRGY